MGLPHTGCSALGRRDFIRVLLPAARMMAMGVMRLSVVRCQLSVVAGLGIERPCDGNGPLTTDNPATRLGFEPRQAGPKPAVLPLHHRVVKAALLLLVVYLGEGHTNQRGRTGP